VATVSDQEREDPEPFSKVLKQLVDEFVARHGEPSVAVLTLVSKGNYSMEAMVHSDRPDVFQSVGLLDQMKLDLLASIPENQPVDEEDLDVNLVLLGPMTPDEPS